MSSSRYDHLLESRARRRCALKWGATLAACALIAFSACKTPTPDEHYGAAKTPSGGGGKPPAGAAGAKANGGGGGSAGITANSGGNDDTSDAGVGAGGAPSVEPDPDPLGCGERPTSTEPFTREALRAAAADCAMWQYCRFETAATVLRDQAHAYQDDPGPASLAGTQAAWRDAMSVWSSVELFQFGPLGSSVVSAGRDPVHGQGIRDLIYAWPAVARCKVEDQVIGRGYDASWATVSISARGLYGLEYLLFYEGSDTICNPNGATAQTWATLDEATLAGAKLDYAMALSDDVLSHVKTLRGLWSPEGQNFRQTFIDASGYDSEQQALNVIAWSLIYAERELKDWKLGIPAGFTMNAPVSSPETPFAQRGTDSIVQNLRGFRALFQGCGAAGEGLGFDDWLVDVGQAELAADMIAALDGAQAAAAAFPPLEQASTAEIQTLYGAVKALTNLLKSDFFGSGSVLNLELPAGVEGDTD